MFPPKIIWASSLNWTLLLLSSLQNFKVSFLVVMDVTSEVNFQVLIVTTPNYNVNSI